MKDMIHRSRTICGKLLPAVLVLAVLLTAGCRLFHRKHAAKPAVPAATASAAAPAPAAMPAPASAPPAVSAAPAAPAAPAAAVTISDDDIRNIIARVARHQIHP